MGWLSLIKTAFSVINGLLEVTKWFIQEAQTRKLINGEIAIQSLENLNNVQKDVNGVKAAIADFRARVKSDPSILRGEDDGFKRD